MYKFILCNNKPVPATGEIVLEDGESIPFGSDTTFEQAKRHLEESYEVVMLEPPPPFLSAILKGRRFSGQKELQEFLAEYGASAE